MPDFYTVEGTRQNEEQDNKRQKGNVIAARMRLAIVTYTCAGTEVSGDNLYLFKPGHPIIVDPTNSSVVVSGAGVAATAAVLDVGDDPSLTSADPDRYTDGLDVGSTGVLTFSSVNAAARSTPHETGAGEWIVAQFATITGAVSTSAKLTFRIAYTIA